MPRPLWFIWKTFSKSLVYLLFVLGALFLVLAVFPFVIQFVHPLKRSSRVMRGATSLIFRAMRVFMAILDHVHVIISKEDQQKLRDLASTIVVSNHPSLLDVTILMSYLSRPDCIVNAKLFTRPVIKHVVKRLFIPNSIDFSRMLESCRESLDDGNCLVIFPEGTRTRQSIPRTIKKGSARISLDTGYPVLPLHIRTNDMRGLQKGDPFYRINKSGYYFYKITLGELIYPETFTHESTPIAARRMTEAIYRQIFPETAAKGSVEDTDTDAESFDSIESESSVLCEEAIQTM